ncbi:cellulase family glycosylhydrolase [uncultured Draconibacterium sp.]|uniref:cellulase family glycosylhydrolase n=1 Tax=uncultured Draconibacterium sp. TaxID=1573823 RepID=UPI002AA912E2|nr:cellulase family glycosylhydrolase [uncultured Draconibacterium sp.]
MINQRTVIFFLLVLIGLSNNKSFGQFDSTDFLKASGPVIRNQSGDGDIVALRGTNLGSWLSMEHWIGALGYGVINRQNWQVTGSVAVSGNNFELMLDGDEATKWNSGTTQNSYSGQYITIDCQDNVVFDKIIIAAGNNTAEAPASYTISISTNGMEWTDIASGSGSQRIEIETGAAETRYVRFAQTGSSENTWSIAEFYLLMNDDFSVRNATYDRFGVAKADSIWDYYQDLWITEADLDSIKSYGMNMVRVPFYWMEVMNNDGTIKENAFTQMDWIVEQCSEREIYVMLDLHGAPGGLDGYITSGQAVTNELWSSAEYQQMTVDLWKAVAEHFEGEPAVCAYDLMNEPVSNNASFSTSAMYDKIYQAVREIDPDHIISVQAFYNFDMISSPFLIGWENVLYQAHYYNTDYNNWDSQNGFINYALSDLSWHQMHWKVPVLAGEYNFWNHLDLWSKWMNGINSFSGSWSNWCYKNNTGIRNWGLFLGNVNPAPDLNFDSEEEIKAKWDKFTTPNFRRNIELIDTITGYAKNTVYIGIGDAIYFEAYDGSYISSENGTAAMTCNTFTVGESEIFTIVDAGDGKIALLGNNGKYVSSNNGTASMTCDKDEIGENEKFYWIDLSNGEMALLGKGGFVSMEGGSIPINSDRTVIDGWEIFSWGKKDIQTSVPEFEQSIDIFPNPLGDDRLLNYNLQNFNNVPIHIYNAEGQIMYTENLSGHGVVDLSFLSSGLYIVDLGSKREKLIVR